MVRKLQRQDTYFNLAVVMVINVNKEKNKACQNGAADAKTEPFMV